MLFVGDLCFSALNRCFSYCLLSFACLDGLFYVICLSLLLIAHFFCFFVRFVSCLSFFRIACCWFSCLDAFSSLSKTKLTGGLARAGAARRR